MSKIKFHHLKPTPGSSKSKLRKGRGESGKRGKTAGRGTKGTGARKTVPAYFEGGQIPLCCSECIRPSGKKFKRRY